MESHCSSLPASFELGFMSFGPVEVSDYAMLTRDTNPIHLDNDFAASRALEGTIVHGTLLVTPIWQALIARFGMEALAGAHIECKFIRPVRVGAMVHIQGECIARDLEGTHYSFALRTEGSHLSAVIDLRISRA